MVESRIRSGNPLTVAPILYLVRTGTVTRDSNIAFHFPFLCTDISIWSIMESALERRTVHLKLLDCPQPCLSFSSFPFQSRLSWPLLSFFLSLLVSLLVSSLYFLSHVALMNKDKVTESNEHKDEVTVMNRDEVTEKQRKMPKKNRKDGKDDQENYI